jgi:putative inorganic carbon (hco3(-)) transporter
MPAPSIVTEPEDGLGPRILAGALESWLRPLQALIAVPTVLFLTALTAMLFWNPDVSFHYLNRISFALLLIAVVGRAVVLKHAVLRLERASWPMIALTVVVSASMVGKPIDDDTWGVLAAKYIFPFTLFHLAGTVFAAEREIRRFEAFSLAVLSYLSLTAIAFLLGANALVFPKFILDPNIGYHVDRARGPFLQAVANGVSLNMLALLVLHAYRRRSLRGATTTAVLASVPIAILATMTRAVWLSFAGSLLAILLFSKNRRLRLVFIVLLGLGVIGLAVVMNTTHLGGALDDRMSESAPVEYRKAVYAGGWQMFLDRPLTGWGFHQMPAELPRYVGELHEKVLYPHNTYLEVAVENGILGLTLYGWLMWELWRLGRGCGRSGYVDHGFRRLWPVFLAVYWVNAAVVVMSYQFVNGLLFTVAGMVAGQGRRLEARQAC